MGSFIGHIDEALFFIFLASWWMYNKFPSYIQCQWSRTEYKVRLSHPLNTKRFVPLESILKTAFPFAGFIGEFFSEGVALIDEEGNFRKLAQMQHMSIYLIFIVHGVIDIMMSYKVPLPKGLDYFSAMFAFAWYGLSFTFHAHMHGKAMMETNIHILPVYIIAALVIAGILEFFISDCFLAELIRTYCLLVLGTWFTHVAFMLYVPFPLPGSDPNPKYDQSDERNIHFVVAAFGFHLILNMCIITGVYLFSYWLMWRKRNQGKAQFLPLLNEKIDEEI